MSNLKHINGSGFEIFLEGYFELHDKNPMVGIRIEDSEDDAILISGYVSDIKPVFDKLMKELNKISKRQYIP